MAFALTKRQSECLDFVRRYIASTGQGPTVEEIAADIGLKSKSGAHRLLNSLIERGHIRRLDHRPRALELTDASVAALAMTRLRPAGTPLHPTVTVVLTPGGMFKHVRVSGHVAVTQVIE